MNVNVTPVNDPPTAVADAKTAAEDTKLSFLPTDLTANDVKGPPNENTQTLSVTGVSATANTHGTVSLTTGTVMYSPDANYNGPSSFEYTVCDNGTTNGAARSPVCDWHGERHRDAGQRCANRRRGCQRHDRRHYADVPRERSPEE